MKQWRTAALGLLAVAGCASSSNDGAENATSSDLSASHGSCTNDFGNGLSGSNGRLDGTVFAIVAPTSSHQCNGDRDHVHVQVQTAGQVYDVAVNTDGVGMVEKDEASIPGGTWREGWHKDADISYTSDLDLHTNDFGAIEDVSQRFETALAGATQVSVYAWLYGKGGVHLVHKSRSSDKDGAFVIQTAAGPKVYAFRFDDQTF